MSQERSMTSLVSTTSLPDPPAAPSHRAAGPASVEFGAVGKRYGAATALSEVDLRIAAGETVALLGPNGAGKSTAINLMLGLLQPTSGTVRVLGDEPRLAVRRGLVGAMLQESGLPILTRVGELVELVRGVSLRPMATAEILRRAGLTGLAGRRTESLSGGEAQRVRFALAIAGDPELLFLDEPTVAMDVETRRAFWSGMRAFAAEGRTILFATHYLEEADQVADRIVVLDHGRVVADGSGAEIKAAVSGRTVRFRLAGADRALLAALPGVSGVDVSGDRVTLESADPDATARALLRTDLDVRELEIAGANLESAFLALTGEDDRQEAPLS
jgi:ABC-2 type transport system ATP-binding protein